MRGDLRKSWGLFERLQRPIARCQTWSATCWQTLSGASQLQLQKHLEAHKIARATGRPVDTDRNEGIARLLASGQSWSAIQDVTGFTRATIAKIAKRDRPAA